MNKSSVENVWELTKKLVEEYYPRLTGTDQCNQAAVHIQSILAKSCDKVELQKFSHRPNGFLKFLPWSALLHYIGTLLLFMDYLLIAELIFALNVFIFISQLLFYWGFFDFPFKSNIGQNIIGVIEPTAIPQQQIIFSAHYDAPYVFQIIEKIPKYYPLLLSSALFAILFGFLGTLVLLFIGIQSVFIIILLFISLPVCIFFFFTTSDVSPGAGDNAISVALIVELSNLLSRNRLIHTRVIIAVTDAEESGLNGAKAYVQTNKSALLALPTYNVNLDSLYTIQHLRLFTRDLNSTLVLNLNEANLMSKLSEDLAVHLPLSKMPIGAGATDAAEFAKIGIPAVSIVGVDLDSFGTNTRYHSSRDTMDGLSKETIKFLLELLLKYSIEKDKLKKNKL